MYLIVYSIILAALAQLGGGVGRFSPLNIPIALPVEKH